VVVRTRSSGGASGQHYLRSSRLADDLVGEAEVAPDDLIVEIGGGTGILTQALLRAGAAVIAIERDAALATDLRKRFAAVEVVAGDAATYGWPEEPFSVVANLPFTRSGAILAHLLGDPGLALRRAEVIVQWEFAAKHGAAWPATLRSTYWRAWWDVSIVRRLDRTAFAPPPSVDAAVLRLTRRDRPRVPIEQHAAYWVFLSAAFALRGPIRNGLRPLLSPLRVKRLAPVLGFAPDARARDLDAGQWARLFAATHVRLHPAGTFRILLSACRTSRPPTRRSRGRRPTSSWPSVFSTRSVTVI
jgi:23S rRNA (adenine-N6)-dimethyltransferase